jgi:hypothetical protein
MTIRLSPEARRALSREITNHDRWTRQYRDDRNYSLATMTRDDYLRVAEDFGIDVQAIVDRAASSDAGQSSAKAERAASAFSGKADLEALGIRHGADVEATSSGRSAAFEARAREQWAREAEERREAGEREARSAEFKNQYPETLAERAPKTNGHDNSAAGKLMALIAELSATNVNPEQVRAIVNQELAPVLEKLANAVPTIRIELTDNGVKIGEIEGHKHPKFARLLRACSAKDATGKPTPQSKSRKLWAANFISTAQSGWPMNYLASPMRTAFIIAPRFAMLTSTVEFTFSMRLTVPTTRHCWR